MHRLLAFALLLVGVSVARGQEERVTLTPSDSLNALAEKAVSGAVDKFKEQKLSASDVSVTIIDMRDPTKLTFGHFRGEESAYPASVVKLFYLRAVHRALEDGKLPDSEELRRAMHDMVVDSVNEATNFLLET